MQFLNKIQEKYQLASSVSEQRFLTAYTEVDGSSLSRIWQHMKKDNAFGIITAFKSTQSREENLQANLQLAKDIRQSGFGYFWLKGYWSETGDQVPDSAAEDSLFIAAPLAREGELKDVLEKLTKKYEQTAFVWKGSTDKEVFGVYKDGTAVSYGTFHPDRINNAYSKIMRGKHAGRSFTFASVYEANNHQTNAFMKAYLS